MLEILMSMSLQLSLMQRQLDEYVAETQVHEVTHTSPTKITLADVPPILKKVAQCESGARQYNANGRIVKNPVTPDYGIFQINAIHVKTAQALGYDIFSEEGNIRFAMYLYQKNGLRDWNASKHCWKSAQV
jgi:hypothetical protein